jgi:type 2 lantibiotic (TIGR03893 family)
VNEQVLNTIVGDVFEELSITEMQALQGSGDVEVETTPIFVTRIKTCTITANVLFNF